MISAFSIDTLLGVIMVMISKFLPQPVLVTTANFALISDNVRA